MSYKKRLFLLLVLTLIAISLYMFYWLIGVDIITIGQLQRGLSRRLTKVIAMVLVAISMGITSLYFQTLTQNRILTPSIIGFDATFVLTQTLLVFFLSSTSIWIMDAKLNFILSTICMLGIALLIYNSILRKGKNNIALLLLVGLVLRTLMTSFADFLSRIMDPEAFNTITALTLPSLSNMDTAILYTLALPMSIVVILFMWWDHKTMDVMVLGEDVSKSLGVHWDKMMIKELLLIAILISISTALVGPLLFMGLLTVNLARELFKTEKHQSLIILSSLLGVLFLVMGQFILQTFEINTSLAILINLIGGIYMILLLIQGGKA